MAQSYLGTAAIKIGADTSDFDRTLKDQVERAAPSVGERFASGLGKAVKVGLATAGAAGSAAFGYTLKKGFDRLVALDTARGQFKGLGLDVEATMEQVGKGVTDTSLSMAQGASIAVASMATGNLPLQDLEAQIKRVSNVSAAYGVEAEHAGLLLNNVLTKNKVTWGDLSQMVQNKIPIVSMLAKEYGVTGDEIQKMVEGGKISVEDLNRVIDKNAGEAAEAYAGTWAGITANIRANVGKLGADILDGAFPQMKAAAESFLAFLKNPAVKEWGKNLGESIGAGVSWIIEKVQELMPVLQSIGTWLQDAWEKAQPVVQAIRDGIGNIFSGLDGKAIGGGALVGVVALLSGAFGEVSKIGKAFLKGLGPLGKAIGGVGKAFKFLTGPVGIAVGLFTLAYASNEDFREAVNGLLGVILDLAGTLLDSLLPPLQTLMDAVLPVLVTAFEAVVPVLTAMVEMFSALVEWLAPIIAKIAPFALAFVGIVVAVKKVIAIFKVLKLAFAANPFGLVVIGVIALIAAIKALWDNSETFRNIVTKAWEGIKNAALAVVDWFTGSAVPWLQGAWDTIKEGAQQLWGYIQTAWEGIKGAISAVADWITGTAWPALKSVFDAIAGVVEWLYVNVWRPQWLLMKMAVEAVVGWVKDTAWPWLRDAFQWIGEKAKALYNDYIKPAWDSVLGAIKAVVSWVKDTAWPWMKDAFEQIGKKARELYDKWIKPGFDLIKSIINAVVTWLKNTAWPAIKWVWDTVGNGARTLYNDYIKPAWDNIRSGIDTVVGWMRNTAWPWIKGVWDNIGDGARKLYNNFIKPAFDNVKSALDTLVTGFNNTKDAISRAWSGFKDAISGPIRSALTWINDHFIKPANSLFGKLQMSFRLPTINFSTGGVVGVASSGGPNWAMASGGVLPGYTPGRDVHEFIGRAGRLLLSGGEAIMRPEWTRAVGKRTIDAWNAASRRGPGAVRQVMGFSDGGIIPTHAYRLGGAVDWLKKRGTDIVDWASATAKALTNPAEFVRNMITSAINRLGVVGPLGDMAKSVVERTVSTIVSKIKAFASEPGTGTREGGGMGWQAMKAWFENAFPGQRITSGYRPGAVSITGIKSDHALGRAIDMPPSMAIFNTIDRTWKNIRQLLYSPAGPRQIRGYRRSDTIGSPLRAQHWDHVHWAMAKGGILKPLLFDSGGVLPPGKSWVENRTGKPEPLARADTLTPQRPSINLVVHNPVSEPTEVTLNRQMQRLAALGVI